MCDVGRVTCDVRDVCDALCVCVDVCVCGCACVWMRDVCVFVMCGV